MKPTFTIGVFAIIHDDERRVLLCHRRDHDLWNLPGGALEHGEAPWDGVIREVREETGLEVEVSGLAGVYSKPEADDLVFSFLCRGNYIRDYAKTGNDATSGRLERVRLTNVNPYCRFWHCHPAGKPGSLPVWWRTPRF